MCYKKNRSSSFSPQKKSQTKVMAAAAAYFSTSACSPPLFHLRVSSSSSSPPPHGGPSSSKPDKARSFASITLMAGGVGVGVALATSALVAPTAVAALAVLEEPPNALSLPTWAIHVSSVVEWFSLISSFFH